MQTQCFMHYISQEIDPKGKVNMHCSRHALIGLFGHCPEAKTHFTVLNPKHRFNCHELHGMYLCTSDINNKTQHYIY